MARKSREIWTADCETDPFKLGRAVVRPFLWGAYNPTHGYHQFEDTEEFAEFIKNGDKIVYMHNGGKFDALFLAEYMDPYTEVLLINNRLSVFDFGDAEIRDSYCILPVALADYQKTKIDYKIFESDQRHKPKNWKKICDYLKDDCVFLHELVMGFLDRYGKDSITIASAAMKQWRKISKVKVPKTTSYFYGDLSQFYFGGRVECFESGIIKTKFKVIDINSAYPDTMSRYHPWGKKYNITKKLPKNDIERCFIKLECESYGALPFRDEDDPYKKLMFPADGVRRVYKITGHEYLAGLRTDTIKNIEIIEVYEFEEKITFKDYVHHFYSIKEISEKGTPDYIYSKLFLTSLYGKFAANPNEYKDHILVPPQYIEAYRAEYGYEHNSWFGKFSLMDKAIEDDQKRFYNVATGASITGAVRAYLWETICECDRVLYCDTDSIACCGVSDKIELHPTRLGAWDVEAECVEAAIAGKKFYAFKLAKPDKNGDNYKVACKGGKLPAEDIYKVAAGEEIDYTPLSPTMSIKTGSKIIERTFKKTA